MIEAMLYALAIMSLIGLLGVLFVFVSIIVVFFELFRWSCKHQEEYLYPVGREAKEWKDKVEKRKGKPHGHTK